jgi:hypothetical protein
MFRSQGGMPLFERAPDPPAHHNAPETSREAAERIRPKAETLRAAVLGYLVGRGKQGATDEEIQDGLCMSPNTERPRRQELEHMGFVERTQDRRLTRSGRPAVVWVAKGGCQ